MLQTAAGFHDPHAYRAIFFEETQEHLADVESILLRLRPEHSSVEDLNAIFRAIHSIKGSASMLGCGDMAALAHLQENLLDVLRKEERPLDAGDVEAMLQAGDVVRAQALRHRGVIDDAPDSAPAEALLRRQLALPRTDARAGASGPVVRRFAVALGPLPEPVPQQELDTMFAGLGEMGAVRIDDAANSVGGTIRFTVELEGTVTDLQEVLSLLVAPELIAIEKQEPAAIGAAPAGDHGEEFFVDPEEFRRKRAARSGGNGAAASAPSPAAQALREPESRSEPLPASAPDTGYIRVATEKIDQLVNLVGELVITEAMLARCGPDAAAGTGLLESGLADLARHTRNLQESVLAIRMLPISNAFARFPRLVHELATRLGKRVQLTFAGEATELDRGLIEKISDPLMHLVRNAIDHGIELPQEREAAGKPPEGSLRLYARQRGGAIVIEVSDDGRGLDRARILAHAAQRGMPVADDVPDEELWQLLFEPGFSTAAEVTDLSGRGVGMDVVRRNMLALGGSIGLASTPGHGTTVTVSVPLTLAIIEAMIVAIGDATYVLPLATVVESLSVDPKELHVLPGQGETLRVREAYLPVLHLAQVFPPSQPQAQPGGIAVIVEADGRQAALIVDQLVGQQQIVVKSLEANFHKVAGLSGATVMGDGSVALILDVSHLVRTGGRP